MGIAVQPALAPGLEPPADARLTPPVPAGRLVARPRLLERLRASSSAAVVVVHAPAGYGKTTLLSQWAAAEQRDVAWLSIEPADDDAVALAAAIAHALQRIAPVPDEVFAALRSGEGAVVPLALPRIARALDARDRPFVLMLDEVQHVTSPRAADVLATLLAHVPAGSQVVLSGRARPLVPLARLRAEGRLAELAMADVRLTPDESAQVLRASGVELPDGPAQAVAERTEGWAAAVYLSSLILRDPAQRAGVQAVSGDDEAIAAYFHEEVIPGTPAEDLEFLTRTAILERLTPALCDAVLERSDSAERLRALAAADLFVVQLDRRSGSYRVHQLFREHLLERLRRSDPRSERELHRRAGAWCGESGDMDGAIRHALAAGDREAAAAILWQLTPAYESQGRAATLQRWLSLFTPADMAAFPALALTAGWSELDGGDGRRAADWAAMATAAGAGKVLADGSPVSALAALLEAAIAEHGIVEVQASAARAREQLPPGSPLRSIALLILGAAALVTGDRAAARELLTDGVRVATLHDIPSARTICLAQLALLDIQDGRWEHAHELMHRARSFQHREGMRDYATHAGVFAVSALVGAQRGDRATAHADALTAARLLAIQRGFIPWLGAQSRWALAEAQLRLGEVDAARTYAAEALREVQKDPGATFLREQIERSAAAIEEAGGGTGPAQALTTAELRTLQYLPTHLSLREIGDRLYVSRNTVKTHTVAIYRKLEASSRSEAVERARGLGLLEPV
jgi:LuxR family maltose regulon positive regulatory protein